MKTFFKYLSAVVLGLILGLGSAWCVIRGSASTEFIQNGHWRINTLAGSKDLGIYAKAYVAAKYLFALNNSETLYYLAVSDSQGSPLTTDCTYLVKGMAPKSRWWSLTAYDDKNYLISNSTNRYAFSGDDLNVDPGQEFQVLLGSEPRKGNWLPIGKGKSFNLILRLYNPSPEVYQNVASYPLPQIIKENCK